MFGVYIRFIEGHGRWIKRGIATEADAIKLAEAEAPHWSATTTLEVWQYPVQSSPIHIRDFPGKLPRIQNLDE